MGSPFHISVLGFIALIILLQQFNLSYSLVCNVENFSKNRTFQQCDDLPYLDALIHWNYIVSNSTLNIAFSAHPGTSKGWVAWAINPFSHGMVGSQSLVAYMGDKNKIIVETYNITSYELAPSKIDFEVLDMEAEISVDGYITIYATLILPKNWGTTLNHVWQVGPYAVDGILAKHQFASDNMNSMGKLDLVKGESNSGATGGELKHKYVHGILNTLSWGFLFPVGVIMARYLRTFESLDPAWFYLHVSCQVIGYVLGVAGWGTGMKLGYESKGLQYGMHRKLGIALFYLCTMQVFALFLRPKKDHRFRKIWNFYHHTEGYVIVILGILNVFKGISILNPPVRAYIWINPYILLLYVLLGIAILAEVVTWIVYCKKRSPRPTNRYPNA